MCQVSRPRQDYCDGAYSTDFLIEHDGKRIALECKSNLGRDTEKTEAICDLLAKQLNANFIVADNYIILSDLGSAKP